MCLTSLQSRLLQEMLLIRGRHSEKVFNEASQGQAELEGPFLHAQPVPTKWAELLQGCPKGQQGVGGQRGCYWALATCYHQAQHAQTTAAVLLWALFAGESLGMDRELGEAFSTFELLSGQAEGSKPLGRER